MTDSTPCGYSTDNHGRRVEDLQTLITEPTTTTGAALSLAERDAPHGQASRVPSFADASSCTARGALLKPRPPIA
jgi:hypothetical protein